MSRFGPYNCLRMKMIRHIGVLLVVLALVLPAALQPLQAAPRHGCCGGSTEAPCAGDDLSAMPPACCRPAPAAPAEPAQQGPVRTDSTVTAFTGSASPVLFRHPPRLSARPGSAGTRPADCGSPPLFTLHASFLI
jgi:hypothetical protein